MELDAELIQKIFDFVIVVSLIANQLCIIGQIQQIGFEGRGIAETTWCQEEFNRLTSFGESKWMLRPY